MPRTFRPIAVLILVLAILYLEARALGRIPAYVQYCEKSQHTGHEECATYHVALFAFWQIGKFFDAISPAVTAFATGFIALFTATIWAINRSQLKHGRQVERGYVSGGFGQRDDTNRYFASIHNNGKTPVVIDYMLIGICPLNQLPPIPEISKRQYVNYSLPPLTRTVALNCWAEWNGKPDHVFFGRFWYTDIFEQTHESGFAPSERSHARRRCSRILAMDLEAHLPRRALHPPARAGRKKIAPLVPPYLAGPLPPIDKRATVVKDVSVLSAVGER